MKSAKRSGGREWRLLRIGLLVGDCAFLVAASVLATYLRWGIWGFPHSSLGSGESPGEGLTPVLLVPIVVALLWLQGLYDPDNLLGGVQEYGRAVTACVYAVLVVVGLSYALGGPPVVTRSWLLLYWLGSAILVVGWRFWLRRVVYRLRSRGFFVRRMAIAGANDQGVAIARQLDSPEGHGVEVVGFVSDYLPAGTVVLRGRGQQGAKALQVLGDPGALDQLAREHGIEEVILVPQALSYESQRELVESAALGTSGFTLRVAPTHYDLLATGTNPIRRGFVPLLTLHRAQIVGVDAWMKTALDYGVALVGLALLWPVIGLLALVGHTRGVRPVVEWRRVEGQWGRQFGLMLFGPWLRKHLILRGLPALWNVVRGQISLVGARPLLASGAAATDLEEPKAKWRPELAVKPGLIGPWRLAGADLTAAEIQALDMWYVRNYTIWEDLRILYQALRAVVWQGTLEAPGVARWEAASEVEAGKEMLVEGVR